MKKIMIFAGLLSVSISTLTIANAAKLVWQVDHPFRFLKFSSDHKIHELAFEHAKLDKDFERKPVSTMEALLNKPNWWTGSQEELEVNPRKTSPYDEVLNLRVSLEGKGTDAGRSPFNPSRTETLRQGWAAMLRTNEGGQPADGTCWNHVTQSHNNCVSEASGIFEGDKYGYVMPKIHYVTADIDVKMSGTCRFELSMKDGSKLPPKALILLENDRTGTTEDFAEFDCNKQDVLLKLPFKPDNKTHKSIYQYILEARSIDEDGEFDGKVELSTDIQVSDYMVVAMGDSFSSGEGNPDVPAVLDPVNAQVTAYDVKGNALQNEGFPRRKGGETYINNDTAAKWIDRRCHRSMYAAPTRAAVALSFAGERHHAVTYISNACSGAEITDGILWPQDGQECITPRGVRPSAFMEPQISGIVRELSLETGVNLQRYSVNLAKGDRFAEGLERNLLALKSSNDYCNNWPGARKKIYRDRRAETKLENGQPVYTYLHRALIQREVDILFLTAGGNDMGFAPLIKNVVVENVSFLDEIKNSVLTYLARIALKSITIETADGRLENTLPSRYQALHKALQQKLEMEDQEDRVIIAAYPPISKLSNGGYCDHKSGEDRGNLGMSVSRVFAYSAITDSDTRADSKDAHEIVGRLNTVINDNKDSWIYVDGHIDAFAGHAICQKTDNPPGNEKAENFLLPQKVKRGDGFVWKTEDGLEFDPTKDFWLYAKRQRWFRTNNDVYMGVHYFKKNASEQKSTKNTFIFSDLEAAQYNALRSLGGAFHPTAEGHAAVADALVTAAMKKLQLSW